jgi:LysM repeat protein
MPEPLVYLLLAMALLLPVVGAVALRLIGARLGARGLAITAATLFGVAIASALILSRSDVGALRIGDVSLLLPGTRPGVSFALPADIPLNDTPVDVPATPPVLPTLTPRPSATATATSTPPLSETPTVTPEPATATPEPATATPVPPTAAPVPPAPPPATRRYTVAAGDSLRGIAEKFGVTVDALLKANNLTKAQGDALRVGQELVIP